MKEDVYSVLSKEITESYGMSQKDFYSCSYNVQRCLVINYFKRILKEEKEEKEEKGRNR